VDGTLATTATKALEADGAGHVVTLGNLQGANAFSGMLDDVRMYNRALTLSEIQADRTTPITPQAAGPATPPIFITEVHSATDASTLPPGAPQSSSTLSINASGTNRLLLAAWHAEWDGGFPNGWSVTNNGVAGTSIVDTDGYNGGAGNRRFRIYYWLNPPLGSNTVVVTNPQADSTFNELAVSVVLLGNVAQTSPLGPIVLDVSTSARTGESETASSTTNDLVVHVIADALVTRGTLGTGEISRSVANDGAHPADGDASLWISTKPGELPSTAVSSSGWASRVINGAAIVVHGISEK
jgi:Concanavalin A-like lectin/glucanases superfamily